MTFGMALAAIALTPAAASALEESAPAAIVAAFDETCRRGFPDLQAVRQLALAAGWTERSIRPVGGNADFQAASLPQVFGKGSLTLFLTTPNAIGMKHGCQVAGPVGRDVDIAALASAASSALGGASAQFSEAGGAQLAQWRTDPHTLVQASLNRRPRSASLQMGIEP